MTGHDLNVVLDDALKTAIYFLEKSGEFYPFAVVKTHQCEIHHVQIWPEDEKPPSDQVIALLHSQLSKRAMNGDYMVTVITANICLADKERGNVTDAIRAEIESNDAPPVTCYLPYSLRAGVLTLGTLIAEKGNPIIFAK